MRVALLWPYYPPEMGAASNRGATLAAFLRSEGCEVVVCAPEPSYLVSRDEPPPEVPVQRRIHARIRTKWGSRLVRLLMEALAALAAIPATLTVMRGADVVVVSSPPLLFGLAGVVAARIARKPVLLDVRDLWPDVLIESGEYRPGSLTRVASAAATLAYRLASAISVVTVGSVGKIEARGIPKAKIILAPNGVEAALAFDDISEQFRAIHELARTAHQSRKRRVQFRLVYAGLLGPAQGVGILLEALDSIKAPVRIDVVGGGSEAEVIRRQASALDVEIRFHGLVGRTKALEIAARSDAAFVPLSSARMADTIPSKIFEAMALGVPVLAVTTGEAADIIAGSGGGLVSSPGNPKELAANIEAMVSDRERLIHMGEDARTFVQQGYVREVIYVAILERLRTMANKVSKA